MGYRASKCKLKCEKASFGAKNLADIRKMLNIENVYDKFVTGHNEILEENPDFTYRTVDLMSDVEKIYNDIKLFLKSEISVIKVPELSDLESDNGKISELGFSKNAKLLERYLTECERVIDAIMLELGLS